jgi:hypothetical protein
VNGAFGIVANIREPDRVLRTGAKIWLVGGTGGEGWTRFKWHGLSHGGRRLQKWAPTYRFNTFRAKWIPEHIHVLYPSLFFSGTREEMVAIALRLEAFADTEREQHPNRYTIRHA